MQLIKPHIHRGLDAHFLSLKIFLKVNNFDSHVSVANLLPASINGVLRSFKVIAAPVEVELSQLVDVATIGTTGDLEVGGIRWAEQG